MKMTNNFLTWPAANLKYFLFLLATLLLCACASKPRSTAYLLDKYELKKSVVTGDAFNHVIFENRSQAKQSVHLYIAGDGIAWVNGKTIAPDPTPRRNLALNLMAQDNTTAALIGRPCYFEMTNSKNCQPDLWTFGRYSQDVVASMLKASLAWLNQFYYDEIILIGYSGGGTLAMLMAPHLPKVTTVVTVAGNLNTESWTRQHNYLPLYQSLNPFDMPSLPARIRQVHIVGGKDKNISAANTASYIKRHGGELWNYPRFDHSCCWLIAWPDIIARLNNP